MIMGIRRMTLAGLLILLATATGLRCRAEAVSAWAGDPAQGTLIQASSEIGEALAIIPDGSGGAIITWKAPALMAGTNPTIRAQKIASDGAIQWAPNGVSIRTSDGLGETDMTSDGSGGAIIAWREYDSGNEHHIRAQRVDSSGSVRWPAGGAAISTASGVLQSNPQIVADGAGGAIITWELSSFGSDNSAIYAQRVDADGAVRWAAGGLAIGGSAGVHHDPRIVSDGSGGAIVTWEDYSGGPNTGDIYAQRIDSNGTMMWTSDNTAICADPADQFNPQIVGDGAGGATIVWTDRRSGNTDVYGQRVDHDGAAAWTANGAAVCSGPDDQGTPGTVADASGGAIVTWSQCCSGGSGVRAQRIDPSGAALWAAAGVAVCPGGGVTGTIYQVVSDTAGGAIFVWPDAGSGSDFDLYAQKVDSGGALRWAAAGVAVCTVPGWQLDSYIISDGSGGAIVVWPDFRTLFDIYGERIAANGTLVDTVGPEVNLFSPATSPASTLPIPVTATFSEAVTGFALDDISVGNGNAMNLVALSSSTYSFDVAPAARGPVTVDVPAGAAFDAGGHSNVAATQYATTYDPLSPTIKSFTAAPGSNVHTVVISGTNFIGVSGLTFGRFEVLAFTVDSPGQITATVDHGVSGTVYVTTARGTAISNDEYVPPGGESEASRPGSPARDQPPAGGRAWVLPVVVIGALLAAAAAVSLAAWLRHRPAG